MDDAHHLCLAPAFDVLPTGLSLGVQSLAVGQEGHAATLTNAFSAAAAFGLSAAQAKAAMRAVISVVDTWQAHFAQAGVPAATIAELARQIDRPALRTQRQHPL
jgi:serine/threonine-protein kinase HipA